MKKWFCLLNILFLLFALGTQCAFAADFETMEIRLNATPIEMKAVVKEGYIYLPVRAISEFLNYNVERSEADQTVTISSTDKVISLNFKDSRISVNDHDYFMAGGSVIINDSIYMRADFFSDNFALKVQWDKIQGVVFLDNIKENAISIRTIKESSESKALKLNLQYPVIDGLENKLVQDEINKSFKQLAEDAAKEGAENVAKLAPFVIEYPDRPSQCVTYFNYKIKYNQNDMISIVFQDYQYAGGAHGSTLQTSHTVNLKTGNQYALKDLLKENADYVSIISSSIKTQLNERNLTRTLFAPFNNISNEQYYYLSNNGVIVYFQQYEILPYVAGIQEFTVDYSLLNNLFKEPNMVKYDLQDPKQKEDSQLFSDMYAEVDSIVKSFVEIKNGDKSITMLLFNIVDSAKQGKVINCVYPLNTTVIEDVIKEWGQPNKTEYVALAKGSYADFPEHKVVFGFNKGSQIFEVQSFDTSLQQITLDKVLEVLGKPVYTNKSNGEVIIGYIAGTDYKLLLAFSENPDKTGNLKLDHYSVFYPRGTVNIMSGDPGREWSVMSVN